MDGLPTREVVRGSQRLLRRQVSDYKYGYIKYIKNCGPFEDAPENNENLDMILIGGWAAVVPEDLMTRAEWEASTEVVVNGSVTTIIDYEAAGLAYWNEERIGSTEPDKPPFDDYEKFKGIWIERARKVLVAALNIEEDA